MIDISRRSLIANASLGFLGAPRINAPTANHAAPAPYGALPSAKQVRWHGLEFYSFLHFTVNTFTDKEWGYGDESPSVFNPTAFDADAIVSHLKSAGMRGVILTCKHHDGFCLWPTATTERCVRNSPWRGGKGDVVKEVSRAAERAGLEFGVYLSPWDRSTSKYGTPEYIKMYQQQLRELLTGYGPLFEIWHDGANGGDGFYGGAKEKRTIDKANYYRWSDTWEIERELQPGAVRFSDVGPDVRWVGNENGYAGETCWATFTPVSEKGTGAPSPGDVKEGENNSGTWGGKIWIPAECDVSIRPGWFWHENENSKVRDPANLLDLYYKSIGRGASFLLNVPPDRRGLLGDQDVKSLTSFGQLLRATFGNNLAAHARCTASNIRGNRRRAFGPNNLIDNDRFTYWTTDEAVTTPSVVLDLLRPVKFDIVRLREDIKLGQRVQEFAIDYWTNGDWQQFGNGTSIGACRIVKRDAVTTNRVRLRITKAPVVPAMAEVSLFKQA